MKMKKKYADVEVKTIEFIRGNAVLNAAGSLTTTSVTFNERNVEVYELQEDDEFKSSSFKDLTF